MTKTCRLSIVLLVALTAAASAAVQPVIICLGAPTNNGAYRSYAVPAGKVFILESGHVNNTGGQALILSNTVTGANTPLDVSNWCNRITCLQPPLKIPENWTISAVIETAAVYQVVTMFGLLVDPEDVYAAIPSRIDNVAWTVNQLEGDLVLTSPRRPVIQMQGSADLATWYAALSPTVEPTADRMTYHVALPSALQMELFRAKVRARDGSGGM